MGFQDGKAARNQAMAPVSLEFLLRPMTKSAFKIIPTIPSTGLQPQMSFNGEGLYLAFKIIIIVETLGEVVRIILTNTGIETSGPRAVL